MSDEYNKNVIKTYVFHKDRCFFVSTINRECSSMAGYGSVYSETLVFDYDWSKKETSGILYQASGCRDAINVHQHVVEMFHKHGDMPPEVMDNE